MIKQATKSVISVVLLLLSCNLMADLILTKGGATGAWFNQTRNGEGFYIEIINIPNSGNAVSVAMYSFDENGDQLWLVGTGAVLGANDVSAQVPLYRYDGPVWGSGFDTDDLNGTVFGTITVRFPTCDSALFSIQSDGALESGDYSLVRLTNIEGVDCTEPPEPPTGLITGTWRGFGVCFHVSADGNSIIGGETSGCDAQMAFDANLDGITNELRNCKSSPSCEGIWPIVEGRFTCLNSQGELATGTFTSPTSASGVAVEPEAGIGEFCTAPWTASPE